MKTMIQAAAVTLFAASAAQAQQAVQWKVSDGGNGHWYSVRRTPSPICWDAASELATAMGGYLATITSSQEHERITSLTGALQGPATELGPWIGATCSGRPWGDWYWVTGEPFAYQGWLPTAPNPGWNEEYVHLWRWLDGRWNDGYRCGTDAPTTVHGYVIEWSADCNGDGIVDYGQCRDGSLPDYNGNNIPDCCESGTACVAGNYPVQWRVEDGGNGHWYAFRVEPAVICWNSARDLAELSGGHLATITSDTENQLLLSMTIPNNPGGIQGGPYIGGTCEGLSWGQWYWITGEPFSYTAWLPGAPNGSSGATEPYLHFWRWSNLGWNDQVDCGGGMFSYLVEWSADCNNDGIVDKGQILQGQFADVNQDGVPDICQVPTCVDADLFRDFTVNGADLGILLSQWGPNTPLTVSDLNGDGGVDGADLGLFLSFWGPCPN